MGSRGCAIVYIGVLLKGHRRRHCVRDLDVQVQIFRMILNTQGIQTLEHSMFQKTKMHALEKHFCTCKESLYPFLSFACASVGQVSDQI